MLDSLLRSISFLAILVCSVLGVIAIYQTDIKALLIAVGGIYWFYTCYKILSGKGGV